LRQGQGQGLRQGQGQGRGQGLRQCQGQGLRQCQGQGQQRRLYGCLGRQYFMHKQNRRCQNLSQ